MFKLNVFTGNLDEVGASSANPFFGPPVDTEADLPVPGTDGEIRTVKSSREVYQFSLVANNWKNVTKEHLDAVGSSPNTNGLSQTTSTNVDGIVEKHFQLQPADGSNPGVITALTQSIGGTKTFDNTVKVANGIDSSTAGGTIGIGFVDAATINIGHSGATVNIQGTTNVVDVTNLEVTDKNITINKDGAAASASGAGLEVEENASITGYAVVSPARTAWNLKAPATAGVASIVPGAAGFTLDQGSHNPVSFTGTGLGLSFNASTQALAAQAASTTQPGLLTDTDFNIFNNKADSNLGNLTTTAINQNLLTDGIQRDIGTSSSHWGTVFAEHLRAYNHLRADSFLNIAGTKGFLFTGSAIAPNGSLDLGTSSSRFGSTFLSSADISGNINMNNTGEITNVVDPTAAQSAATKNYVDNHIVSLTTGVSGVLPIANGGTNNTAFTTGSIPFYDGTKISEANADLFWDNSTKRLGVGTVAPVSALHVVSTQSGVPRGIVSEQNSATVNAAMLVRRSRGSFASPTALQSNDVLGSYSFQGHGATTYGTSVTAGIIASALENFTDSAKGTSLSLLITPSGSATFRVGLNLTSSDLSIGNGSSATSSPAFTFRNTDVSGAADTASGNLIIRTGKSTGNVDGGNVIFQGTNADVSGSTQNTLVNRLQITKGRLILHSADGTKMTGLDVSDSATTHNYVLPLTQGSVNSTLTNDGSGNLSWNPSVSDDIALTTFSAANNQATPADITGLAFNASTTRSFEALLSITLDATTPAYEAIKLIGINKGGSFDIQASSIGDVSGVTLSITNAGQVQYISSNATGFVTLKMAFRAITTQV